MRTKMKRFFGILLSIALMLGLMPGMSLTVRADGLTIIQMDNGTLKIGDKEWTTTYGNYYTYDYFQLTEGSYQLGSNISIPNSIVVTGNVTLDLLGYNITAETRVFKVGNNNQSGNLTINDSSQDKVGQISGNFDQNGGGIYLEDGTVIINGGKVSGNAKNGGGIYLEDGTVIINGGEISGSAINVNAHNNIFVPVSNGGGYGGGIYIENGEVIMNGGKINGATATYRGAGVCINGGTFTLKSGEICNCKTLGTAGAFLHGGAGVSIEGNGKFCMEGGKIHSNFAKGRGGGVIIASITDSSPGGIFEMKGGEISQNKSHGDGGGVYLGTKGTITMEGGEIINNNIIFAEDYPQPYTNSHGAGVYINAGNCKFNVKGNPVIKDNTGYVEKKKHNDGKSNIYNNSRSQRFTVTGALTGEAEINITNGREGFEIATAANEYTLTETDVAAFKKDDDATCKSVRAKRFEYYDVKTEEEYVWYTQDDSGSSIVLANPSNIHNVKITPGQHMTQTENSGSLICKPIGEIKPVVFTADEGYYFNEVTPVNGIDLTCNSNATQITVSGTPTADTEITIPNAVKKETLTITGVTATNRAYDKDIKAVTISEVTFQDSNGNAVELTQGEDKDYIVTGVMKNANAGDSKTVDVTVTLKSETYGLANNTTTTTVNISKADAPTIADVTRSQPFTETNVYTYAPDNMPEDAGELTFTAGSASTTGNVTVSEFTVSSNSGYVNATLSGGAGGDTVTLPVIIKSTNYADSTVNVVITLTKTAGTGVTISGVPAQNKTYGDADFTLTGSVTNGGTGTGTWTWDTNTKTVFQITPNGATASVKILKAGSASIMATYETDTTVDTSIT